MHTLTHENTHMDAYAYRCVYTAYAYACVHIYIIINSAKLFWIYDQYGESSSDEANFQSVALSLNIRLL